MLVSKSEEACLLECEGMHSAVNVDPNNRTLAINRRLRNSSLSTFLDEYLHYRQFNESKFASFFREILPEGSSKEGENSEIVHDEGWPFLNEQSVLQSFTRQRNSENDREYTYIWVEQRLEIVEIYFTTPTFDLVVKDGRTNFVTKTSMIGGMLGLFTGFSILSGIEIVYFSILLLNNISFHHAEKFIPQ